MKHRSSAGAAVAMLLFTGVLAADAAPPSLDPPVDVDSTVAVARSPLGGPTLGGCRMFPADNPWNVPIDGLTVRSNSSQIIANIQAQGKTTLHHDFSGPAYGYGMPFVIVPENQPKVPIVYDQYPEESDPGPFPIPLDAPTEGGGDRHVLVLQRGTCMVYELWAAYRCGSGWCAGTGAKWDLRKNQRRPINWTSADAAGLAILPGLVRCDEMTSGAINHAIRVTFERTNKGFVLPATHGPSSYVNANFVSFGMRLRLKAGYDISGFTGQAKIMLTTFKKYGLMVADNGNNWYFQGQLSGPCFDDNNLQTLSRVPGTAFEVVDTGRVYPWPYNP